MSKGADFQRAFPIQWTSHSGDIDGYEGMSLRDYFAGQALMGLCSQMPVKDITAICDGIKGGAIEATAAYRLADKMLEVRDR